MKFIYIADTHIGASDPEGYHRQPRYPEYFQEIVDCLNSYITESNDIDFIIHGGDMIDSTSPELISAAADFFGNLPCPTYLALGNHDLTTKDAVAQWLKYAPEFFPDGKADFRLIQAGVQIDVLLCNWGETPAFWDPDETQTPWLSENQLAQLDNLDDDCFTQIVITHSPMYGLPPQQHGGNEPLHSPPEEFCKTVTEHLNNSSLVLGAHNHMNMVKNSANCSFATVSSFSETPFEFKLIEITRDSLSMQTIQLGSEISFQAEYYNKSAFVQGRPCDRIIERSKFYDRTEYPTRNNQ